MINYIIINKTRSWNRRLKRVDSIVNKILKHKQDLNFNKNINYYCNIILTNDKLIKSLNRKYKNKNISTDVLTFISEIPIQNKIKVKYCDIFLSIETIVSDAKKNKIDFYNHLTHLFVHSFLHINDYVHNKAKDFIIMKNKEINILNNLGISNPYYI